MNQLKNVKQIFLHFFFLLSSTLLYTTTITSSLYKGTNLFQFIITYAIYFILLLLFKKDRIDKQSLKDNILFKIFLLIYVTIQSIYIIILLGTYLNNFFYPNTSIFILFFTLFIFLFYTLHIEIESFLSIFFFLFLLSFSAIILYFFSFPPFVLKIDYSVLLPPSYLFAYLFPLINSLLLKIYLEDTFLKISKKEYLISIFVAFLFMIFFGFAEGMTVSFEYAKGLFHNLLKYRLAKTKDGIHFDSSILAISVLVVLFQLSMNCKYLSYFYQSKEKKIKFFSPLYLIYIFMLSSFLLLIIRNREFLLKSLFVITSNFSFIILIIIGGIYVFTCLYRKKQKQKRSCNS